MKKRTKNAKNKKRFNIKKSKPSTKRNRQVKKPVTRRNKPTNKRVIKRTNAQNRLALSLYKEFLKNEKTAVQNRKPKKSKHISKTKSNSKKVKKPNSKRLENLEDRTKKSKYSVVNVLDKTFEERLVYRLELFNYDKIDISDIQNQNPDDIFNMLERYFLKLYSKLKDPKEHFSILFEYYEGTYTHKKGYHLDREFDFVSTPIRRYENMPDQMYIEVRKLIDIFLRKINDYKKFQANFILESVSIQIFNNERKPQI